MKIENVAELKEWIEQSKRIVFFGGAGTSTESGIPDFRTSGGLYNKDNSEYLYPPETMVSHSFLCENPEMFFQYYKEKLIYPQAKPNWAHKALAEMERQKKLLAVITQNIDGLHQMAGSREVVELHGSVHTNYCTGCGKMYSLSEILALPGKVPTCLSCGKMVRPDVTLYQESLKTQIIEKAIQMISLADMLIVGGTSLVVYPAAGFVHYFSGKHLVLINKDETGLDKKANMVFRQPIGSVLREVVFKEEPS